MQFTEDEIEILTACYNHVKFGPIGFDAINEDVDIYEEDIEEFHIINNILNKKLNE